MDRTETGSSISSVVVPATQIRESAERTRVTIPRHHVHVGEPVIELVREGNVVRAIDVTCPCGQRFRLLCEYGLSEAR